MYVDTCLSNLIPKSWALIWSWSPPAITASTLLGRLSTRCWNIAAGTYFHLARKALEKSGTDWVIRPGLHSVFQVIPKMFDGVEVRALCRPVKLFHIDLNEPLLYGPCFVMLKQERAFPKLLSQSGKHIIV